MIHTTYTANLYNFVGNMTENSEISAMQKNQWPYTYVGLCGVENGHMVGVTHALCSVI